MLGDFNSFQTIGSCKHMIVTSRHELQKHSVLLQRTLTLCLLTLPTSAVTIRPAHGTLLYSLLFPFMSRRSPPLIRSCRQLPACSLMQEQRHDRYSTVNDDSTPKRITKRKRITSSTGNTTASPIDDLLSKKSKIPAVITPIGPPISYHHHEEDGYFDLAVPAVELRPSATLTTGQCFHWHVVASNLSTSTNDWVSKSAWGTHDATEWIGTLRISLTGESVVVAIRETTNSVWYRTLYTPNDLLDVKSFLYAYFQLSMVTDEDGNTTPYVSLQEMYQEWSTQCDRLRQIAECIPGVRIVDQDPWECLVSFLCSSNNNIPRITKMLNAIRREYGEPLCTVPTTTTKTTSSTALSDTDTAENHDEITLYSFPSLKTLTLRATEDDLRQKCGLGYRAKYLIETMRTLNSLGGELYLQELRSMSDPIVVQEKLIQLHGVGRKVADCVALFSLRQCNAIPVDVHVWQIAKRDYGADMLVETTKSLTPTVYKQIGDLFRTRFPNKSGWAHSLLFVAELPSFRPVLPQSLILEMEKFRLEEKAKKVKRTITF